MLWRIMIIVVLISFITIEMGKLKCRHIYSSLIKFKLKLMHVMLFSNLIVEVVIALIHLLQSEAPLILHMNVRVELPLCSLHKLTNKHTHAHTFISYTGENSYYHKPLSIKWKTATT